MLALCVFCRTGVVNCVTSSIQWIGVIGNVFNIHCWVRQCEILSPIQFIDLIKELRLSGYETHLNNLFVGQIFYADEICLISHLGFGDLAFSKCWIYGYLLQLWS